MGPVQAEWAKDTSGPPHLAQLTAPTEVKVLGLSPPRGARRRHSYFASLRHVSAVSSTIRKNVRWLTLHATWPDLCNNSPPSLFPLLTAVCPLACPGCWSAESSILPEPTSSVERVPSTTKIILSSPARILENFLLRVASTPNPLRSPLTNAYLHSTIVDCLRARACAQSPTPRPHPNYPRPPQTRPV